MEETKNTLMEILTECFGESVADMAAAGGDIFFDHGHAPPNADYLDSLDRTEYIMAIEDRLDVEIPDAIASGFKSFDDIVRYVSTMMAGPANGAH